MIFSDDLAGLRPTESIRFVSLKLVYLNLEANRQVTSVTFVVPSLLVM